jgi:tetratricopeptide (TPR) repeat protein
MDRTTGKMAPDDLADLRDTRGRYLDGLRDWARNGAESVWALSPNEVRERMKGPSPDHALARAYFQLGEHLWQARQPESARKQFDEAIRLHPESWAYKRQAWDLEEQGKAGGPEFWKAVEDLGDTRYYPPIQLPK